MPELKITIGGRDFEVACQEGEEHFLRSASQMLDNEAQVLIGSIGRIPEARMLLMSGLMLADKTAGLEDSLRAAEARAQAAEAALEEARANPAVVEVAVIPPHVNDTMAELAARAEAIAQKLDEID
ncbi:cell division protein ZapA [Albirhodobacter sp. R86504]|jgi:cell division protein ZapA|uniref:cell division protein ZapA n=1 Tax=Albirhodobacter sp. R86504 TaxID=3093848 RepID=UPI00366E6753